MDCCFSNSFAMSILENPFLPVFKRIAKSSTLDRLLAPYVIKRSLGFHAVPFHLFSIKFSLKEIKVGDKLMKLLRMIRI